MKFRIESVAYDIKHYKDVLNKFDAVYHTHEHWFGGESHYAVIELLTLGDLAILQEELERAVVYEEGTLTIYDGYLE